MQVWIIPLLIASFYGNVRGWAEHTLTAPGHPLTITRTVTSNPLFSFLNINLNYHLEHHLFPGVPWYNLPKVHRLLLDDYRAAGASVYRSYARFLYDAFRTGINGPPLRPEIGGRLPA
jgi:fatty acid desaturase